jgi:hypothetical protein
MSAITAIPAISFVPFVVNGFAFPIARSPDHQITRSPDSCGPLPASFSQRPTPHTTFVETKAEPKFNRAVDRAVEAFFPVFQRSNLAQF